MQFGVYFGNPIVMQIGYDRVRIFHKMLLTMPTLDLNHPMVHYYGAHE